jgi:hypothetical protein
MFKNSNPVAMAFGAVAVCSILATAALSPVSASSTSFQASSAYFPDQYVNQAREIEPMIDTDGDSGLSQSFPDEVVNPAGWIDATPEMYS